MSDFKTSMSDFQQLRWHLQASVRIRFRLVKKKKIGWPGLHIVNRVRIFSTEFVKLGYADYYSDVNLSPTNHKLPDNASIKGSSDKRASLETIIQI